MAMLIKHAFTEPQHPAGRKVLSVLNAAKDVRTLSSKQRAADYSFVSRHRQSLGMELKTERGFYQDIITERLDFQLGMLAQDYDIPVVAVVGPIKEGRDGNVLVAGEPHRYKYSAIQRKITRMQWVGITVQFFSTEIQAANYLLRMCRSLESSKLEPLRERPPQTVVTPLGRLDAQAKLLATFPGIADGRARDLLDKHGTLRSALQVLLNGETAAQPGLGPITANKVDEFLDEEA